VLQCVEVCRSVLHCVRVCCSECDKEAIGYKVCALVEKACVAVC